MIQPHNNDQILDNMHDCNLNLPLNVSAEVFADQFMHSNCNKRAKLTLLLRQSHLEQDETWEAIKNLGLSMTLILQAAWEEDNKFVVKKSLEAGADPNKAKMPNRDFSEYYKLLEAAGSHLTDKTKLKIITRINFNAMSLPLKDFAIEAVQTSITAPNELALQCRFSPLLEYAQKTPVLLGSLLTSMNACSVFNNYSRSNARQLVSKWQFISKYYSWSCDTQEQYSSFQHQNGGLMLINASGFALLHALLTNHDNKCAKQLLISYPEFVNYANHDLQSPIKAAYDANNIYGVSLCWQMIIIPPWMLTMNEANNCTAIKNLAITLPNVWEESNVPYEQSIKHNKEFVLIIQGPMTDMLMQSYIESFMHFIRHNNISYAKIGDGKIPLSLKSINLKLAQLQNEINQDVDLIVVALMHGYMLKDPITGDMHHAVGLSTPSPVKTAALFETWQNFSPAKSVSAIFISCFGGGASKDTAIFTKEAEVLSFAMSHQMLKGSNFGEFFTFHGTFFDSFTNNFLLSSPEGSITFPIRMHTGSAYHLLDECDGIKPFITDHNIEIISRSICSKEDHMQRLPEHSVCEQQVELAARELELLNATAIKTPIVLDKWPSSACTFEDRVDPTFCAIEVGTYTLGLSVRICQELKAIGINQSPHDEL